MKILLKILVAPFALALSLLAALLVFLFDICAVLLTIASVSWRCWVSLSFSRRRP